MLEKSPPRVNVRIHGVEGGEGFPFDCDEGDAEGDVGDN
jgi:hypothetical protein